MTVQDVLEDFIKRPRECEVVVRGKDGKVCTLDYILPTAGGSNVLLTNYDQEHYGSTCSGSRRARDEQGDS